MQRCAALVKRCKEQLLCAIAIQSIIFFKKINKNIGHLDTGITNPALTCGPSIERSHLVMQSARLPHEAQSISYDFLVITCVNSNARTNVL